MLILNVSFDIHLIMPTTTTIRQCTFKANVAAMAAILSFDHRLLMVKSRNLDRLLFHHDQAVGLNGTCINTGVSLIGMTNAKFINCQFLSISLAPNWETVNTALILTE